MRLLITFLGYFLLILTNSYKVLGQQVDIDDNDVYIVSEQAATQRDAELQCKLLYNGHLVSILNQKQQVIVENLIKNQSTEDQIFWTSLYYTRQSAWIWPGNNHIIYNNWHRSASSDNTCGGIKGSSGKWIDVSCQAHLTFICRANLTFQDFEENGQPINFFLSNVKLAHKQAKDVCKISDSQLLSNITMMINLLLNESMPNLSNIPTEFTVMLKELNFTIRNKTNFMEINDDQSMEKQDSMMNRESEECLTIHVKIQNNVTWVLRNSSCSKPNRFICIKNYTKLTPAHFSFTPEHSEKQYTQTDKMMTGNIRPQNQTHAMHITDRAGQKQSDFTTSGCSRPIKTTLFKTILQFELVLCIWYLLYNELTV